MTKFKLGIGMLPMGAGIAFASAAPALADTAAPSSPAATVTNNSVSVTAAVGPFKPLVTANSTENCVNDRDPICGGDGR